MSDHLADLNEKITMQADDIERLKFELKVSSEPTHLRLLSLVDNARRTRLLVVKGDWAE